MYNVTYYVPTEQGILALRAKFEEIINWLSANVSPYTSKQCEVSKWGHSYYTNPDDSIEINQKFNNIIAHYISVADPLWSGYVWTRNAGRAVGKGWAAFYMWHWNRDGYLENHTMIMVYDELVAVQLKLIFL
jgi:hypothetical protein